MKISFELKHILKLIQSYKSKLFLPVKILLIISQKYLINQTEIYCIIKSTFPCSFHLNIIQVP